MPASSLHATRSFSVASADDERRSAVPVSKSPPGGASLNPTRRGFLKLSGAATIAATGLPLFHFRESAEAAPIGEGIRQARKLASWEDLYR